jgi:hypothetical protein
MLYTHSVARGYAIAAESCYRLGLLALLVRKYKFWPLRRCVPTYYIHTVWLADTQLLLKAAAGSRDGLELVATIGALNQTQGAEGLIGTNLFLFSYDVPAATAASRF